MSHKPNPVNFQRIPCPEFPTISDDEIRVRNFSQDQSLFLSLCCGVISGKISSEILGRKLGLLNHARWLTLGQRILCLHIMNPNPCKSIQQLAKFTISGYGAIWFLARMKSGILDAPKLLFQWIKGISRRDPDMFEVVRPILENGCYYFHSENLLLSVLGDLRKEMRK